jgi:hypothetical protein
MTSLGTLRAECAPSRNTVQDAALRLDVCAGGCIVRCVCLRCPGVFRVYTYRRTYILYSALIVLLALFSAVSAFRLPSPALQAVRERTRSHVLDYVHAYICTLCVHVCVVLTLMPVCLRNVSLSCCMRALNASFNSGYITQSTKHVVPLDVTRLEPAQT